MNRDPQHYTALCALAQIATHAGRADVACDFAQRAVSAAPEGFEGLALLAAASQSMGRVDTALDATRSLAALRPRDARIHYNLGVLLEQSGARGDAQVAYRSALSHDPEHLDARANLCMLLLADAPDAALEECRALLWRKRGQPGPPGETAPPLPESERCTSRTKLRLELEQFLHLEDIGAWPDALADVPAIWRAVLEDLGDGDAEEPIALPHPRHHWKAHWQRHATLHNRPLHLPEPACPAVLINPALDRTAIESAYHGSTPQLVVVDDLLTDEALDALWQFCRDATIWYDQRRNYLGAYFIEGFANALTLGIARQLAEALPGIFGDHPLTQAWGYKYGAALNGIGMHADAAAVNCNFWLAPDAANLDPASGGLRVYRREAPLDWDFDTFNNNEAAMRQHLGTTLHDPIVVPHRRNRMVIFNSNLIHQTDNIRFRDDFDARRYNITLLYGRRGKTQ